MFFAHTCIFWNKEMGAPDAKELYIYMLPYVWYALCGQTTIIIIE